MNEKSQKIILSKQFFFSQNNRIASVRCIIKPTILRGTTTRTCKGFTNPGACGVYSILGKFQSHFVMQIYFVLCHAFSFSKETREFANTGLCPPSFPYIEFRHDLSLS